MFERFTTAEEAYNYKLGATLTMERNVLDILEKNIEEAKDPSVAKLFRHHHEETQGHVRNVEEAFGLFGWDVDDSPCPTIEALEKEGKTMAKKADDAMVDAMLLQGSVEVEHHEIAVYENLIIGARALGRDDVVQVLQRNMEQEQHTLEEVRSALERLAASLPARA
jgi:ferritin-like metal-binding protein YciE